MASEGSSSTAACLVGQQRSLELTATSLRRMLEAHGMDGFVVLSTTNSAAQPPSRIGAWAGSLLGPRVVRLLAGTDDKIVNQTVLDHARRSHAYATMVLERREPGRWRYPYSAQLAMRHRCYEMVAEHEAAVGRRYAWYVRTRLDVALFEPLPAAFLAPSESREAVVPEGEDYGAPAGLNDRLISGPAAAFYADAHAWMALGGPATAAVWVPETVQRSVMLAARVAVRRLPLAYCILDTGGACKYPGELYSIIHRVPAALERSPRLCGRLTSTSTPSTCGHGIGSVPPRLDMPQTLQMERLDPGWCSLHFTCRAVARAARHGQRHTPHTQ